MLESSVQKQILLLPFSIPLDFIYSAYTNMAQNHILAMATLKTILTFVLQSSFQTLTS